MSQHGTKNSSSSYISLGLIRKLQRMHGILLGIVYSLLAKDELDPEHNPASWDSSMPIFIEILLEGVISGLRGSRRDADSFHSKQREPRPMQRYSE